MVSTMLSSGPRPGEGTDDAHVERVLRNGKRVFAHGFKLALVQRCLQPGVSVAGVALTHGVNANLLRKWIGKHRAELCAPSTPALLPVIVDGSATACVEAPAPRAVAPAAMPEAPGSIQIDLCGARVTLHGEIDARRLRTVLDVLAQRA